MSPRPPPPRTIPRRVLVAAIAMVACRVAPDDAEREIVRMLHSAAAHATKSGACYDGNGSRVTIARIVVEPGGDANRFAVAYEVTVDPEGDTRGCPSPCTAYAPRTTAQELEVGFTLGRIDVPTSFPGFELVTPLDQQHEGDCHPDAEPFVAGGVFW